MNTSLRSAIEFRNADPCLMRKASHLLTSCLCLKGNMCLYSIRAIAEKATTKAKSITQAWMGSRSACLSDRSQFEQLRSIAHSSNVTALCKPFSRCMAARVELHRLCVALSPSNRITYISPKCEKGNSFNTRAHNHSSSKHHIIRDLRHGHALT